MSAPPPDGRAAPPTPREIFAFWLPVALSGQLITLSQPLINAALGRAPDRETALPAYVLALHFVVLTQAVVLPGMNVAVALVRDRASLRTVRRVLLGLGAASALAAVVCGATPVGVFLFRDVMGQRDPRIVEGACLAVLWLAPSALGVAARGALQGASLAEKSSGPVAAATLFRLAVVFAVAFLGSRAGGLRGEIAGALAVDVGVWTEAAVLGWQARRADRAGRAPPWETPGPRVDAALVLRFAGPLIFGHVAWTLQRPLINMALGDLPDREASVAAFGVLHAVTLFLSAPLWAFQSTAIVYGGTAAGRRAVTRFAVYVSVAVAAIVVGVISLRGAEPLLKTLFGLEGLTATLAAGAAMLIAVDPLVHGLRSVASGVLIGARRTVASGVASSLKVVATLVAATACAPGTAVVENPAAFGMALYVAGTALDCLALGFAARRFAPPRA
jgi:hypothetical protein